MLVTSDEEQISQGIYGHFLNYPILRIFQVWVVGGNNYVQIPSISDYHTHEDDEYESFLAWMVNIPYHDYRDGKS